jgi:hypothetical protein
MLIQRDNRFGCIVNRCVSAVEGRAVDVHTCHFTKPILIVLPADTQLSGFMTRTAGADMRLFKGQTVYVPVYSHIYSGDREQPFYLAATLSIRNTDTKHAITLDGGGLLRFGQASS